MRWFRLLPFAFLLLDACVEPLDVNIIRVNKTLVVDGLITNDKPPYTVKLFYVTQLDNTLRKAEVVSRAEVSILGEEETETLTEITDGVYQTSVNGIQGEIGKRYKIQVVTVDEVTYESDFQQMLPVANIDSVYITVDPGGIQNTTGSTASDGLRFLIDAGLESLDDYVRWRWTTVYQAKTFPELRTQNTPAGAIPDPEPCSGYIRNGGTISKVGECTCCTCWSTRYSNSVVLSDDVVKRESLTAMSVGEVALSSMFFYDRLYVEVEQLSVNEDIYAFWKQVALQEESIGNLFQPNAIRVHGNIHCTSNPEEEVFGIFGVSAVAKKAAFFDRSILPYVLPPIDTIPHDCRDSFLNSSTDKPSFW